jgi:uncharacterized cupredoxin-like copper-binding protein
MNKFRIATLGVVVAVGVLVWALPAMAHSSRAAVTVTVTAGKPAEFKFTVAPASVKAGSVTFKVLNKGALSHDFWIGGKKTPMIASGKSATVTVTLKAGSAAYKCTVPGHAAAGMKGTLKVT